MWIHSLSSAFSLTIFVLVCTSVRAGNPDAKRLYDDLLSNYNKLVRPVVNVSEAVTVRLKLKLSQLIDVNLKNQIMTTNLWVEQYWYDYKLQWDPTEYGGVDMLHVPSDHIWRPDIVLYNNADGNFEVTLATKATLMASGKVEWKPPAIYHSSCEMDVEYFPFDEQTCVMKFGSWTYDGYQVDLRHIDEVMGKPEVEIGVDLTEFYMSVEWDILEVPAIRNVKYYTCCDEPYLDITFNVTMRRKTLFYTVNLIIPCMGISFLTVLVFYLPSDSGEKVSLSISILLSLTVFFLLLAEIIPPTSLVVPLLGKFVLFTMILDTFSICVTVVVLNVHFRTPQTHTMAPWIRRVFIHILPRLLVMRRPHYDLDKHRSEVMKNPRYTFMTPDNEYLDEHEVVELLNSADMQDYLLQQRQYQKMNANHRHPYYTKHNHVTNGRMNHSTLNNRNFTRYANTLTRKGSSQTPPPPPQTHNRILVRTCNGLELRDSPYMSNSVGGYATAHNTTNHRGSSVFQQFHKTSSSFDDIVPPFSELPPRAKSSMSHHSFRSTRSVHEPQEDFQGVPSLNGSCRLHGQSADHLPIRSSNHRIKFNSFDRMNNFKQPPHSRSSPSAESDHGEHWKTNSANNKINSNGKPLGKGNDRTDVCPEVSKALSGVMLIAEQKKRLEESTKVIEDWKYVAMVLDRLFLWIFTVAVLVGTAGIILQAPTLYDDRQPLDIRLSQIGLATARPMAGVNKD